MARAFPALLVFLAAASLFAGLGAAPLFDLDEGAFTAATLEMFRRGDFLSTYLLGEPRYDKPILIYWLQAASVGVLGWNEFALRLPSALMGLAWAAMARGFARRLFGIEAGNLAFVLTTTTLGVSFIARAATADALLNACIAGAVFAQYLWLRDRHKRDLYLAWAAMGLGFLAKGPVAVAIPLGAALLWCLSKRDWRSFFHLVWQPRAWLLFAAIALPWYVAVTVVKGPGFLEGFFLKHNVGRFSGAMEGHAGNPFYYLPVLLIATLPYTGLLVPMLGRIRQVWADDFGRYALILLALVLALFSFSGTKLPHYLFYGLSAFLVLLARQAQQATSPWLLLPALVLFLFLAFFPDLVAQARPRSNAYYQDMLVDLGRWFGPGYRTGFWAAAGVSLGLMFLRQVSLAGRLQVVGLLAAFGLGLMLVPAVGGLLQQPIKAAGLKAKTLDAPLVMAGLNQPSFSVYAERVVYRREPAAGDGVLTRVEYLPELPPHEVLFRDKAIALVRIQP